MALIKSFKLFCPRCNGKATVDIGANPQPDQRQDIWAKIKCPECGLDRGSQVLTPAHGEAKWPRDAEAKPDPPASNAEMAGRS